jgi:NAD(P)-dependent dehydrogenase (short-subunit alcohol dehydrogenase family)
MSTILITGTSTGIGFATAISIARSGRHVSATMRNPDGGEELRAAIEKEDLPVDIYRLDVDDDSSVNEAVARAAAEHGPIEGLVNNAGIGMSGAVEELPLARFRQCMETNFFGALRCIQAVVPDMRERRNGCIVNVTSVAGRIASPPQAAYASSKWALEALSEVLAAEVKAYNVRVAVVEPGVIATPIFGKGTEPPADTKYPHQRRMRAMFAAALQNPVSPFVVGDAIRDIIAGDSWQLRYPVGPDAEGIIEMRQSLSDEQWIDRGAQSDEEWARSMKETLGIDVTRADRLST